jgi:hypothetical protein
MPASSDVGANVGYPRLRDGSLEYQPLEKVIGPII